ncbi:hypothetical protein [Streptomyces sp. NPDC017993]|uniref:hypothetical protein n=1 Tax=Streptomyces sp. NPDC017993 TaxID=3365027 RepID=UPI0037BC0F0A
MSVAGKPRAGRESPTCDCATPSRPSAAWRLTSASRRSAPAGEGAVSSRPSTCPIRAWRARAEAARLDAPDGFVFRALHPRWHTVTDRGLSPEAIGEVTTRARPPHRQLPLPRGDAEESRRAGNDRKVIAKQGGWVSNSGLMEAHFEDADGWEGNAMIGGL